MRDKLGLEAPPERRIVEESVEAAEDKRRRGGEDEEDCGVQRECRTQKLVSVGVERDESLQTCDSVRSWSA
jgi:hypothetical protein